MKSKPVKSRRQGTSLTFTIPAEFKVAEDSYFQPKLLKNGIIEYVPLAKQSKAEHDRQLVEKAFAYDHLLTEKDMEKRFGKYGWGKHAN